MRSEWPDVHVLRHLCSWILAQYPVPRLSQDALRLKTHVLELDLPPAANSSDARRSVLPRLPLDVGALEGRLTAWHEQRGGGLLTFYDDAYPELLRHISRPPLVLFVEGDASLLQRPAVALVGARACSSEARLWCAETAGALAQAGVVVASGMARGIDAAAHDGALRAGGLTFAVLGNGTDVYYPSDNRSLQESVRQTGCLVSELPPGTEPRAWHFPNRNRILAGLVRGVVVVQAELKSGALITARHALDENRDVMAVPGDVRDPRSRGPHRLLRQGAALIECAGDVLVAIGWDRVASRRDAAGVGAPPQSTALLAALARPRSLDNLRRDLGWSVAELFRVVSELELLGFVQREPGGCLRRSTPSDSLP